MLTVISCLFYIATALAASVDSSESPVNVSNVTANGSFTGKLQKRNYVESPRNITDGRNVTDGGNVTDGLNGRNITIECEKRCRLALDGDRDHQLFCIVHCQGSGDDRKERHDWRTRLRSAHCWKGCMARDRYDS
mgnify:CR=1 FL=1